MSTTQYLIAGFGGQGILFAGKFLAYNGLESGANVSWLPSYGPEMRGGTASCGVIISDDAVGSPIVSNPDVLVAMNLPSLDRYESSVVSGGKIFVDSSLVERKVAREDVEVFYIPATTLAEENNLSKLANMVMIGKLLEVQGDFDDAEMIEKGLKKVIPPKKSDMLEFNKKAMYVGRDYKG